MAGNELVPLNRTQTRLDSSALALICPSVSFTHSTVWALSPTCVRLQLTDLKRYQERKKITQNVGSARK